MSRPVATLLCRAQVGLEAPLVQVEVTVTSGLPAFHLVGLPATVVRESRDRVRSALLCSGFECPSGRIVVNLAPAEIPKEGGRFELPIALGILIASGQLRQTGIRERTGLPVLAEPFVGLAVRRTSIGVRARIARRDQIGARNPARGGPCQPRRT